MSERTASSVDRNRSTRASQLYFDRLTEGSLIPFTLLRRRPQPPRGFVFRDGLLQWEEPRERRNVHYYNIYINSEAAPAFRVPVGQTQAKVPEPNHGARQAWISSVNDRNHLESAKVATDIRIPAPVVTAGAPAGNPGTVVFVPTVGSYGTIAFKDFVLTGKADALHVDFWFVDETRIRYLWGQTVTEVNNSSDPVSVSVATTRKALNYDPPPGETPTYDRWAVGDYVVFDDPRQDADTSGHATWRRYEVAKIKSITGDQSDGVGEMYTVTLEFESRGALGSRKNQHDAETRIYRLKKRHFTLATKDNSGNDKIISEEEFPMANASVVTMEMAASDLGVIGAYYSVYCQPLAYPYPGKGPTLNPAPGFRTCQGAQYLALADGLLVAGQTLPKWLPVGEDAGIRNVLGSVAVAPVGNLAVYNGLLYSFTNVSVVFYVLYIEQFRRSQPYTERRVAVLEQCGIRENEYESFDPDDIPDFRRTPYRLKWPTGRYPVIGKVADLYDPSTGQLRTNVLPFTATGEYIDFQESGALDVAVVRIGSSYAGLNLMVTLMT